MRVDNRKNNISDALSTGRISTKPGRGSTPHRPQFQIIFRDRRRRQIPEGFLKRATAEKLGYELRVDRICAYCGKTVD